MQPVPITRSKLFEQVAMHLQRAILDGQFKPGERLPTERELCATFGVGRPAVREALLSLERSGLVQTGNGAPARVSMPEASKIVASIGPAIHQMLSTPSGQRQLQNFRLFIEVAWARHAARHATDAQIARLREALEANHASIGNRDAFISSDVSFHYEFAEIMDSPAFTVLHTAMSDWLYEQRKVSLGGEPYGHEAGREQQETSYQAHKRIYEAVAARNPDLAETAMAEHLKAGVEEFWRRYNQARDGDYPRDLSAG